MKNKLKILSIAICCLVSVLWSDAQCMSKQSDINLKDYNVWVWDNVTDVEMYEKQANQNLNKSLKIIEELDKNNSLISDDNFRNQLEGAFSGSLYFLNNFEVYPEILQRISCSLKKAEVILSNLSYDYDAKELWLTGAPFIRPLSFLIKENVQGDDRAKKISENLRIFSEWKKTYPIDDDKAKSYEDDIKNGKGFLLFYNSKTPPFFSRLPSQFKGSTFLVGGEKTATRKLNTNGLQNYTEDTDVYTLNFFQDKNPDICGDARKLSSLICISDEKFDVIEFDYLTHTILEDKDLLKEYARILKSGGIIIFRTCHAPEETSKKLSSVINEGCKNLKEALNTSCSTEFEQKRDSNWENEDHNFYYYLRIKKPSPYGDLKDLVF